MTSPPFPTFGPRSMIQLQITVLSQNPNKISRPIVHEAATTIGNPTKTLACDQLFFSGTDESRVLSQPHQAG